MMRGETHSPRERNVKNDEFYLFRRSAFSISDIVCCFSVFIYLGEQEGVFIIDL